MFTVNVLHILPTQQAMGRSEPIGLVIETNFIASCKNICNLIGRYGVHISHIALRTVQYQIFCRAISDLDTITPWGRYKTKNVSYFHRKGVF